jgi:hypothetical protein
VGYRPPKGIAPPQLAGRRTGRPKGSRNYAADWANIQWAYENRYKNPTSAPNVTAYLWWRLAASFPEEFQYWYERGCRVVDANDFYDGDW